MNNKELIMNNEQLPVGTAWHAAQKYTDKNNIMNVGAGLVSAQKNKYKNNLASVGACIARPSGITLIALIITIIVMLILAGVVLNLTIGERGIFKTAKGAAKNYINASDKELAELNKFDNNINDILNGPGQTGENTDSEPIHGKFIVNEPKFENTGLIPVTIAEDGATTPANTQNDDWYSYDGTTNHWANAVTKNTNGEITGYFVWIPRYAYKITYNNESDKSQGGTIDVVFLQGTTNKDANGNDVTSSTYVDEKGNTGAYVVHPVFCDESKTGYANGGWDSELTGFWVAKFEAGYDGTANDKASATDSNVDLSVIYQWNGKTSANLTKNYYGSRAIGDKIKYPVFKGNRPCMNNLGISDAYDLCLDIKNGTSMYRLSNIDSHLMKNSEWGAVAYLTHSKYGRNGQKVTINNVNIGGTNTIYAVTGYGAPTVDAYPTGGNLETLLTDGQSGSWTTTQGQKASSTGNMYGIYDLRGGTWEFTTGYIAPKGNYEKYGGSLKGESTKYKTKYEGTSTSNDTNYSTNPNPTRVGEAIWETSNRRKWIYIVGWFLFFFLQLYWVDIMPWWK